MIHAHLLGFIHTGKNIDRQNAAVNARVVGGTIQLFTVAGDVEEVIDERTLDAIIEDAGVDAAYVEKLESQMGSMLTDRAKLDFYDRMESLKTILVENVPTGYGYKDFLDRIGRSEAMNQIGLAGEKPYYIETVYRTNYGTAHSAGRWKAAQASPLVYMLEYISVDDDRRTPICEQLHGTRKLKTDPFWSTYNPLNHFSCRSTVIELTESFVEINNIKEKDPGVITADHPEDFQTNPGESNKWMKSTVSMKKRLKEFEG